jgi:hypothetical protein
MFNDDYHIALYIYTYIYIQVYLDSNKLREEGNQQEYVLKQHSIEAYILLRIMNEREYDVNIATCKMDALAHEKHILYRIRFERKE